MRRQIGVVALASAALLTVTGVAAGAAHADVPTATQAGNKPAPVADGEGVETATTEVPNASEADREFALLRGDREAADLMGFLQSLYLGKWFMPGREDVRKCIVDRESNFNYRANNGTYFGAYQMSRELGVGATWMMQKEVSKEFGNEGVDIVQALRKITPDKWNRYWQDRAFWTIWRSGEGARHWGGARC